MTDFKIGRDPYGSGVPLYAASHVDIPTGLTVLVGCNGSGKTALLDTMSGRLAHTLGQHDYVVIIDAHSETQRTAYGGVFGHDTSAVAAGLTNSEGELMQRAVGRRFPDIGQAMNDTQLESLWVLIDGFDSSVDILGCDVMLETFTRHVFPDLRQRDVDAYVVMATNAWEPVRYAQEHDGTVIDVTRLKRIRFTGYEDYRDYVLMTAHRREERYRRLNDDQKETR